MTWPTVSLTSQPTSAWREGSGELSIQLLSLVHWILCSNQRTVFSHVIRCRPQHLLLSVKSITMSTATMDQWKIVHSKWQGVQRIERKAGTRFILGRKGCLHWSADWIRYNKSSCYASWYFSMGQTTTRWHCPSCVTTRCDREGPGSLEQMVDVSLFAWPDCRGAALHLLIIPRSHKRNPNVA